MHFHNFLARHALHSLVFAALLGASQVMAGAPEAMDSSLRRLSSAASEGGPGVQAQLRTLIGDAAGRVLITMRMHGGDVSEATFASLSGLGFHLQSQSTTDRRQVTGFLPPNRLREAHALPEVSATMAVRQPWFRSESAGTRANGISAQGAANASSTASTPGAMNGVGAARSKAVGIHRADVVRGMGIDGRGIRVGLISDSFDRCGPPACITTAADDLRTGDLPADGVTVLEDAPVGEGADEGRAMLQLVHDIAPGATLAFAAATNDPAGFARNLRALRFEFMADIIVDDIGLTEEPLFGDGQVSQAVEEVVRSGGAFITAVGNSHFQGHADVYKAVPFSEARALAARGAVPVKLDQIPAALRPKTVHVFGTRLDGKTPRLTQRVKSSDGFVGVFQWDEPFNRGGVATEYDLYIFDDKGHWIDPDKSPEGPVIYTMDDNMATDQPIEFLNVLEEREVYLVVGKRNDGPTNRFRWVGNGYFGVEGGGSPTVWGHVAAKGALSVGGTEQYSPFEMSNANSVGPFMVYRDADGQPLAQPEARQAPHVLAVQGTDNTFFGYDTDGSGMPNFSGASAAAPVAAGIAALVLQAAGGPGSLTPERLYSLLKQTAHPIPFPDDGHVGQAQAGPLTLTARGIQTSARDYFLVELAPGAPAVRRFSIDLGDTSIGFGERKESLLGDSRGVRGRDIQRSLSRDKKKISFSFKPGAFKGGEAFHFGWAASEQRFGGGPLMVLPQEMQGARLSVTLEDGQTHEGTLRSGTPKAVNRFTGHGVLDALAAVEAARAAR